jgi:hypothetical protein
MSSFAKKLKRDNHTIGKAVLALSVVMLSFPQESQASDNFFGRFFGGNWGGNRQNSQQAGANAQQAAQAAEREKAAIKAAAEKEEAAKKEADRQVKEQEIAARIAFEKEAAQKQFAQRQEDARKAEVRRQQLGSAPKNQVHVEQPLQGSPQHTATESHKAGQSFGSSLLGGVISAAKSTNPHDVPGFQTDKPKEAFLKADTLGDAALAESGTNEISQHLLTQAQERRTFKIDPNTDPLFVEANRVVSDPQQALNEKIIEIKDAGEDVSEEIKTCEEGGDEYSQSCSKRLEVTLKIRHQTGYHTPKWCIEHWANKRTGRKYKCSGCRGGDYVITQDKKVEATDKWIDGCTVLEDLTEKGFCRYGSKTTSLKNETKTIQGEPVTRDHFEEHYTYTCFKAPPVSNSCTGLREKGCFQIDSKCKDKVGNICVLWEQTYSCPSGKKSLKSYLASGKENPAQTSLFCLTGNCADTSYEANNEMMNAMSHLYALREVQDDLRDFKVIFKGTNRWCTRNCLGFRDCCGGNNGWGVTLHLSDCDKAEIELRTLRDKNLCVQVGTYCAERDAIFDSCIRKKTTFCCYGTKMARLIQQNGRAQLGIGFGSPESPNCDGLSPEQLSRIDFSKINFSEIFEDIKNKTVAKDQKQSLAALSAERLQENMTLLTKPRIDQKQLATKHPNAEHLNAEHLAEKSAQELQKIKEKGL